MNNCTLPLPVPSRRRRRRPSVLRSLAPALMLVALVALVCNIMFVLVYISTYVEVIPAEHVTDTVIFEHGREYIPVSSTCTRVAS